MKNEYEDSAWERNGYFHPGKEEGTKWLAAAERKYQKCAEGFLLNLCCGNGRGMEYFFHYGSHRYGLDCSEKLLEQARKEYPGLHWICRNAGEGLPFQDSSASALLCECSLSLFGEKRQDIYQEIHRILKPEGLLLMADIFFGQEEEPEGFTLIEKQDKTSWLKAFIAQWLWENESMPPFLNCGGKNGETGKKGENGPGYFLLVYRRNG